MKSLLVLLILGATISRARSEEHTDEPPPPVSETPQKWHFNPSESDPSCVQDPNDPGDYGARVVEAKVLKLFGKKGKCIDTAQRRSVILLTPSEAAKFNPQPGEIVVGNVSQLIEGRRVFGVAKFRLEDMDPGYVWYEHFDEHLKGRNPVSKGLRKLTWNIGHLAVTIPFKKGHEMDFYPDNGRSKNPPIKIPSIVLSGEAVPIKGVSELTKRTLFLQGLRPAGDTPFATASRMTSGAFKTSEMLEGLNRSVDFVPLKEDFTRVFARTYLNQSEERRMTPMYHTLGKDSFTCVDIFGQAFEASLTDKSKGLKERKKLRHNPGYLVKALSASEVLGEGPILQVNRDGKAKKAIASADEIPNEVPENLQGLFDLSKYDIELNWPAP